MANTTNIQILRSYTTSVPPNLLDGQLAYSFSSNTLFIGANNKVLAIGGKYYTNIIDSANSESIPNTLVKRDPYGAVKFGQIITDYYPTSNVTVVTKGYVDNVLASSHGSIYFEEPGNPGYSNAVASSEGVNISADNKLVARFHNNMIYLDEDVTVLNNIYLHDAVSTGNLEAQNIIAKEKFFAGIATSLATQLPNTISQFTGNTDTYVQINAQNISPNGSADFVVTADVGTDTTFYIDTGIQGSQLDQGALKPLDGYLLVQGNTGQPGGNLVIGTISGTPGLQTKFVVGGYDESNIIMTLNSVGLNVNGVVQATTLVSPTIDSIINSIAGINSYTDTANAFNQSYTDTANTWLQANDYTTLTVAESYTDVANNWLQANTGEALAASKVYTDSANTWLQANTGAALADAKLYTDSANTWIQADTKAYTDSANTWLQANDIATLTTSISYTDSVVTSNLANSKAYTDTANNWLQANTGEALAASKVYTDSANTWLQANDTITLSSAKSYTDAANTWLQANTKLYTDTANTWLQANDRSTLTAAKSYTDAANTWLQANDTVTLSSAKSYTDSANTWLQANTKAYTDAANTWLQANDRSTLTTAKSYTDTANTYLQANTGAALAAGKVYTDTANTYLQANTGAALAASKVYTDTIRVSIENEINANLTTAFNYTNAANTFLQANDSITLGVALYQLSLANTFLSGNDYTTLLSAKSYTDTANTWLKANDFITFTNSKSYTDSVHTTIDGEISSNLATAKAYTDTANAFNQSYTDLANTYNRDYTLSSNTWLQANDRSTLIAAESYTDGANTWLRANDYLTWTTSKNYTDGSNTYLQSLNTTTNNYVLAVESYSKSAYAKANSANVFAQQVYDSSNTKFSSSGGFITGFANVSANISVGTTIDFDPNPAGEATQKEGRIFYDKYSKAFGGYNDTPRYIHFGRDVGIRVFNSTGSAIGAAAPVFILNEPAVSGAPHIALADATTAANSEVIGLTQTSIANGAFGMVISQGLIEYLDTTLYTPGQELFLSTTPGQFTTTAPPSPNIPLNVGYIGSTSASFGEIIVNIHLMEGKNKTTGAILFARNQLIDQDPETLYWDYANNSLGIGTNSPAANLHVVGSGLFTGNVIISGNLLVSNAQSITTSELVVSGNTVVLNSTVTGVPTTDAQIIIRRGTSQNSHIRWSETNDKWTIYSGSGIEADLLDSEKTLVNWSNYSSATTYQKSNYSIGADLSNTINELAKTANTIAYAGQAQATIATNLAQSAFNSSNNVNGYANSAYAQANTANTRAYSTALLSGDTFNGGVTVPTLVANTSITVNTVFMMTTNTYTTSSLSQVSVDSFSSSTYRSAKYQIQMTYGSEYHTIELQVLHNGTTVWIAEYGEIITDQPLGVFDASITAGVLNLLFTPYNSSTNLKLIRNTINI
jgi:hypothetical protein